MVTGGQSSIWAGANGEKKIQIRDGRISIMQIILKTERLKK